MAETGRGPPPPEHDRAGFLKSALQQGVCLELIAAVVPYSTKRHVHAALHSPAIRACTLPSWNTASSPPAALPLNLHLSPPHSHQSLYLSVMDAVYPVNNEVLFFIEGCGQGGFGANWWVHECACTQREFAALAQTCDDPIPLHGRNEDACLIARVAASRV
jgi:hypothetical protein